MGAWGTLAFDNDDACDWALDLATSDDLSLVETAFEELQAVGNEYLEVDVASRALAACEVVARLQGRPGYANAYTVGVDEWVAAHPGSPEPEQVRRATAALDRVLTSPSELLELWEDTSESSEWLAGVADLRARLVGSRQG